MITRINDVFSAMFKPGVVIIGLLFFTINAHYEYILYHVNTYKIAMLGLSVILLYIFNDLLNNKEQHDVRIASWQVIALLALPTIATFPGYLWHDNHNYNFHYELITDIFLFLWAAYLFRHMLKPDQQFGFFAWIVPLMVFLTIYSILEFYALNPLSTNLLPTRPKATFGNINYFAGFLTTLTPMFLLLSLPRVITANNRYTLSFDPVQGYFAIGLFGLVTCALLAQSRAALGATAIACLIALVLWACVVLRDRYRLYIIAGVIVAVMLAIVTVVLALLNPDLREILIPGRFINLFQENAWQGRTSPLIAASRAVLASPWIGWGLGASYNLNFIFMPPDTELYLGNRSYNHVHNEFLEMAEEGGVLIFIVWGGLMLFVLYNLLRITFGHNNQTQNKIIAIGCIAGILAFYGHGVFSVAQRMIVANLPLYSLLAIAMAQIYIHKGTLLPPVHSLMKKAPSLFWRFIPSTLFIALGWGLFIPIAISFYYMSRLAPAMTNVQGVIAMEEHMKKWPNPYGLDDLMTKQMQFRRYNQLLQSAQTVAKIIPEYRTLGYKESIAYFNIGQYDKAKQRALAFQQRVGYLKDNILLLGGLALRENDTDTFREELKRLLQSEVIPRSVHDSFNNKEKVDVVITDTGEDIALDQPDADSLILKLSQAYFKRMVTSLQGTAQQRTSFLTDMATRLSASPILQPPTNPQNREKAIELINWLHLFEQTRQHQKKQKRDAYLRSIRPRTYAQQQRARKEIALIEEKVDKELYKEGARKLEQLGRILEVDNLENYLTLTSAINRFLNKIQFMLRYA